MNTLNAGRKMKSKLAIAAAEHGRVRGEANNFSARSHGALYHSLTEIAVALHVQLEPEWLARVAGNVFNGRCGKCADRQRRSRSACSARRGQFAFGMKQAMVGNRR